MNEPIETETVYREALKEIKGLMMAAPDTADGERLAQLVEWVQVYEQKTCGATLESLLQGSPREALSLTQEDREWLSHSLPSENGGRWDSWFENRGETPDFLEDRDQPDDKDAS